MDHVPKLRVEVVAGAVPTAFVEEGPEGFDVKGDAIARRDCLTDTVSGKAIHEIKLVIKPGLCCMVKSFGGQTKIGEGSEIIELDPVRDPRADFLRNGCRRIDHLPLESISLTRELY